jgi:hypothetical protein
MQVIERKVNKSSMLVGDIGAEILPADDVPTRSELALYLPFDDPCHFAIFLGFKGSLQICDLFDGGVTDTDDDALFLGGHVGVPDEDFLGRPLFLLLIVQLILLVDFCHLICIT